MLRSYYMSVLVAMGLAGQVLAQGRTTWVLFDESPDPSYYAQVRGHFEGGDSLVLAGPENRALPLTNRAHSGVVAGRLIYRHTTGGRWELVVYGLEAPYNLSGADTLVLWLNAPESLPGVWLPAVSLVDEDGRETASIPLRAGTGVGWNGARSGWLEGSTTDVRLSVRYVETLPAELPRPGYPEDLLLIFDDAVLDTSQAAIGLPARPARFTVRTADGKPLAFRYYEINSNQTLDTSGEYIEVLTPEPETGRLRPTWHVEVTRTATRPPGPEDRYLLAVDNDGLDADSTTWQAFRIAWSDFGPVGDFEMERVAGFALRAGDADTRGLRELWFDEVHVVDDGLSTSVPEPPAGLRAEAGDSSVVLYWEPVEGAVKYRVYRREGDNGPFVLRAEVVPPEDFADLDVVNGQHYTYIVRSVDAQGRVSSDSEPVQATPWPGLEDAFLRLLQYRSFLYFWKEANPSNGLIRDRSREDSPASIAAVGFGLSALTVGIDRGWITREEGRARVLKTLEFFWKAPQSAAPDATGYQGFFYHFLDLQTGRRAWQSELSTIDTALLLAGILHVRQYFGGAHEDEVRIRALVDSIYGRVRWDWFAPRAPALALGWKPEEGFLPYDWTGYNEAMIMYLLALGSPTHPLPSEAWEVWTSTYRWATHYGYSFVEFPPLFGHQYSHVWIDFRGIQDAYMRAKGIDYFENSRRATLAQRAYHMANPNRYPNYGADEWGLTASDVPGGYMARGAPPPMNDDGTLAPTAPGGSIAFAPEASVWALRTMYRRYRNRLWGPYGFRDAYNVQLDWFDSDYIGIDQGPIVLMIENFRTGAIWQRMMTHEAVVRGLERAGFQPVASSVLPAPVFDKEKLRCFPNPFTHRLRIEHGHVPGRRVSIVVYDVLGREVHRLTFGLEDSGSLLLDTSRWPSGPLLIRMRSGASDVECFVLHLKF